MRGHFWYFFTVWATGVALGGSIGFFAGRYDIVKDVVQFGRLCVFSTHTMQVTCLHVEEPED